MIMVHECRSKISQKICENVKRSPHGLRVFILYTRTQTCLPNIIIENDTVSSFSIIIYMICEGHNYTLYALNNYNDLHLRLKNVFSAAPADI